MSTQEIANKYVDLCKKHENEKILDTLFATNAVSIEAAPMPGGAAEAHGVKAIAQKGKQWMENHEVHEARVEGPWPHGNRFIVRFTYDVTNKPTGRRIKMDETGLFTVENGKIVREEFFYSTGG